MKKLISCSLFTFVLLVSGALGQNLASTIGAITASASSCSVTNNTAGACVVAQLPPNVTGAAVTVAGTWSATLQFEQSADNQNTWISVSCPAQPGGAAATSTTSNATWVCPLSGMTHLRVRASAYTSGVATVTVNPTQGGGGAVGGATSNVNVSGGSLTATQSSGSNLHVNVDNNGTTATGSLTSSSSATCTGAAGANGVTIATIGAGSVGINILISGATNNTVLGFYYSIDGTNYVAVTGNMVAAKGGGAPVTGTATGITAGSSVQFEAALGNAASFMVCGPTTASATATVTLQASLSQPGVVDSNLMAAGSQISALIGPGATNGIPTVIMPVNTSGAAQALTQVKFTTNVGTVAGAVIKASPGNFYAVTINNPNASICFLEIFNATTGQSPGVAVANIVIPATASFTFALIPYSENFATGIAFTGATAADGATGCASAMTGTAYIR